MYRIFKIRKKSWTVIQYLGFKSYDRYAKTFLIFVFFIFLFNFVQNVPEVAIEKVAAYADKMDISGMLQEYMSRLVLEKPSNPIEFLIAEIERNPYQSTSPSPPTDFRPEEEKTRHYDLRRPSTKQKAIYELFCEAGEKEGSVSRTEVLMWGRHNSNHLRSLFPSHHSDILKVREFLYHLTLSTKISI